MENLLKKIEKLCQCENLKFYMENNIDYDWVVKVYDENENIFHEYDYDLYRVLDHAYTAIEEYLEI